MPRRPFWLRREKRHKPKPERASRLKTVPKTLKGLTAREYRYVDSFCRINVLSEAKRRGLLDPALFMKIDRHKPISEEQMNEALDAMYETIFQLNEPTFPMISTFIEHDYERVRDMPTKRILRILAFPMFKMRPLRTLDGTLYAVTDHSVTYMGQSGLVYFSSHVFDRFKVRCPKIMEYAKKNTGLVVALFQMAVKAPVVEEGNHGPQLKLGSLGYCPLIYRQERGEFIWIATTFLSVGMRGAGALSAKELAAQITLG